jgi:hypothetical protein
MAHRIAEEHLNQTVSGEWIGREDPINWLAWSADLNPQWLMALLKTLVYSEPISRGTSTTATSRECLWGDSSEIGICEKQHTLLWHREMKVLLTFMGTTQSTCCRDYTSITRISTDTVVWAYVEAEFFAHFSEYNKLLKFVTLFHTRIYMYQLFSTEA